jgi:superfamily II DNA helicase RecQ
MQQKEGETAKLAKSAAKGKAAAKSTAAGKSAAIVDIQNPDLYDTIRKWRNETAAEHSVPPYNVLSNKALLGITNQLPRTDKELLAISGLGKKLVMVYGKELISMVEAYVKKHGGK